MSKAKRLNEMILMVNRRRKFTVGELAQEFGVSSRTILRDLQELSEMGVPLYSEVGPHGGYQVLQERILPPIAFRADEVIAVFLAIHALRHYVSLPFDIEYGAVIKKFYLNLSGDIRDKIDQMKNRVDFLSPHQQQEIPLLKQLLEAAVQQDVIRIDYEANGTISSRSIQPIGIYASEGKWYCPSYCFLRKDYRVFRCDRIKSAALDETTQPIDLSDIHLNNRFSIVQDPEQSIELEVELTPAGVERYQASKWSTIELHKRQDDSGFLQGMISKQELGFFSDYFIAYGRDAAIKQPVELIESIKEKLHAILRQYD